MKKYILSIIAVIFLTLPAWSQEDQRDQQYQQAQANQGQRPAFLDKIFVGGGLGAGFGDYTFVNISPIIGYRVSPQFAIGMRLMYQYTTFDYYDFQEQRVKKYNGNDFGIGGFARYMLFGPVFLQAEYEHLSYDALDYSGTSSREGFDSFMAGGGIAQPVGNKASVFLTVMYNFSYENFNTGNVYRVPYNSPWVVRVGVAGGF